MRRLVLTSAGIALAAILCACTPTLVTVSPTATAASAEETCTELSDVITVLYNSRMAEMQGRTVEHEVSGARDLAARMMGRVEVEPDTALAEAVADWSEQIIGPNAIMARQGFDPNSQEWNTAQREVADACEAAGAQLFINSWTGG